VLKVGSASLSADDCKLLHLSNICNLVETICQLKQRGYQVILVTSGAVAVGCQRMGLTARPKAVVTKQAIAAIGQSRLMRVYDDLFSAMSQPIAQVLLTRENLSKHHHYVNALNTIRELLRLEVVPVINENDTVAIDELRYGDNDTLSARVASLVQAKWLFLLTDVSGLYDCDPRSNPNAKIVHVVKEIDELNVSLGESGSIGTGGMTTKLVAASIATAAGVHTGIIKSTSLGDIEGMMAGKMVGTHFLPSSSPLKAHKKCQ
jgi:glutamate 5-kinase